MNAILRNLPVLLSSCAAVACGTTYYAFVPAQGGTADVFGHAAADYAVPPNAPKGDLRIASYGVEQLSPGDTPDQAVASLHLRIYVADQSDQAWSVDTREQQLVLVGRGTSTPAFASANPDTGSQPPVVTVAPHGTRIVDVFFPLPPDIQQNADLPAFQLASTIHTDSGAVSETTPFERIETSSDSAYATDYSAPQPDYNPTAYGYDYWDSPFWYNPGYVGFTGVVLPPAYFVGHPVFARGYGWGRGVYYHGPVYRGYSRGFHGGVHVGVGVHVGGGGHR